MCTSLPHLQVPPEFYLGKHGAHRVMRNKDGLALQVGLIRGQRWAAHTGGACQLPHGAHSSPALRLRLQSYFWPAAQPKAVLVFCHGHGAHLMFAHIE